MKQERVEQFVMQYLEATGCHFIEKSEGHVTVRFSPEADKDLMNRSYYWNFVERTGAEPEPMSFTFIFDPEKSPALVQKRQPVGVPYTPVIQQSSSSVAQQGASPVPQQETSPIPQPRSSSAPQQGASFGAAQSGEAVSSSGGAGSAPAGEPHQGQQQPAQDSILGRYFGVSVPAGGPAFGVRTPSDIVSFGSRRLDQLFEVVRSKGRYVRLFEELRDQDRNPFASVGYSTWLHINYKVELVCDMKRDEIHSLGIHLGTGQIVEGFFGRVRQRSLTPQLPPNVHLQPLRLTPEQAVETLESYLTKKIKDYDHRWADSALKRLSEEFSLIDAYYEELLAAVEPTKRGEVEEQYRNREREIDWQYRPRVIVSVINCGFFHLSEGHRSPIDGYR